jgi:hypothetical protein
MPNHYDPEKVELMGRPIEIDKLSVFVGSSGKFSYWMPVAHMGDGKVYEAVEVSTSEQFDEAINMAIREDYCFIDYYRIPRKFCQLFEGRRFYFNPGLP